jgi:hypothetical protein
MHIEWSENLKRQLGKQRRRCEDNIRINLNGEGERLWIGNVLFRIGTSGDSCSHGNELSLL